MRGQISKEEAETFHKQLAQTHLARARFEDHPTGAAEREHYKVWPRHGCSSRLEWWGDGDTRGCQSSAVVWVAMAF